MDCSTRAWPSSRVATAWYFKWWARTTIMASMTIPLCLTAPRRSSRSTPSLDSTNRRKQRNKFHGASNHGSVQDLSQRRARPEGPIADRRQQYVRPARSQWGREEFSDADDCHPAGSGRGQHQLRRVECAHPEERSQEDPWLSAAGIRRVSEDVGRRHAEPSGNPQGRNLEG